MALTPGNGVAFQRRTVTDGSSGHTSGGQATAPRFVRRMRLGNAITAYEAPRAATPVWREIGPVTLPMATDVLMGLAVTSHKDGVLSTAVSDQVSVISAPVANQ